MSEAPTENFSKNRNQQAKVPNQNKTTKARHLPKHAHMSRCQRSKEGQHETTVFSIPFSQTELSGTLPPEQSVSCARHSKLGTKSITTRRESPPDSQRFSAQPLAVLSVSVCSL